MKIYKGIATIPELWDFTLKVTKLDMEKIKTNVEEFLNGVEKLQRIEENQGYREFYGEGGRRGETEVSEFSVAGVVGSG